MDGDHPVDGHPSIRILASFNSKRLDSAVFPLRQLQRASGIRDSVGLGCSLLLPHCTAELIGASDCPECGARMVLMIVGGGGIVQIYWCKGHMLDMRGTNL